MTWVQSSWSSRKGGSVVSGQRPNIQRDKWLWTCGGLYTGTFGLCREFSLAHKRRLQQDKCPEGERKIDTEDKDWRDEPKYCISVFTEAMKKDIPVLLVVKGRLVFHLTWENGKLNGGSQERQKKLHTVLSHIFLRPYHSSLTVHWVYNWSVLYKKRVKYILK